MILEIVAFLIIAISFVWAKYGAPTSSIPGGRRRPFFGNALDVLSVLDDTNKFALEYTRQFGKTWAFTLPFSPVHIVVTTPECFRHILKDNFKNYPKGERFTCRLEDLLGQGIFNADGEQWQLQRKTASHIFTAKCLKDVMCGVFLEHGKHVLNHLGNAADSRSRIDLQDLFFRFTLDSIAAIAFGVNLHCLETFPKEEVAFARAFDDAQKVLDKRFLDITWSWQRLFGVGRERLMKKALRTVIEFSNDVIAKKQASFQERKRLEEDQKAHGGDEDDFPVKKPPTDLLAMFMEMGEDEAGNKFTVDYLRDIALNFIIAGRDTTAQLLSWTFYELSCNPHVEEKLVSEIERTIGLDHTPTYENITQVAYVLDVAMEALRLHPSVPKELKHAINDDVLPDGTHVPAGACVLPMIIALQRSTEVWGSDADSFRPERWQEYRDAHNGASPDEFTFPAFQAGPRTCLGRHMALLEVRLMVVMVLQRYSVRVGADVKVMPESALTLPMRFPLMVEVSRRNQS